MTLSWQFSSAAILLSLLALANSAEATFVGVVVVDITNNDDGLREYAIYAQFNSPIDIVGTARAADFITSTTGWFHNTINGGQQSALPYTRAQTAISDNPDADSFVTIGLMTGDNNATFVDANFSLPGFFNGTSLGFQAGWANSNPSNGQGMPDQFGRVLIAVFTPLNDSLGQPGIVSGNVRIGYSNGGPPLFGDAFFTTVPAPAGLWLIAMPVICGSRRQRS